MKYILLLFFTSWLAGVAHAQQDKSSNRTTDSTDAKLVTVILQNNTLNTRTVTLRFTEPGNLTYGVISTILGPNAKREETYSVGTKIEQLTPQQQQVAMTGKEATGKLIVTLKASDNGRTYNLLD